jgi:FtsZ-binding cell division protein ZapB
MNKRIHILLLSITAFLLAGCAAGRASEMAAPAVDYADVQSEEVLKSDFSSTYTGGEAAPIEPLIIRNANLRLVVEDPAQSADEIASLAGSMGGFVVNSNVYQTTYGSSDIPTTRASITIRVPVERLDEALDKITALAIEVREKNVTGEDVTREYTDLQSRLKNLESAEEQLREIMDNATKTEDVLRVFEDLRQVREEIEVIQGQINYYEDAARLSAISLELIPDELAQPLSIGGWRPQGTAKDAVEALINTLQFLVDAGIWLVICVAPILILLGVPGFFIGRSVFRRRRKSQIQSIEEEGKDEE